MITMKVGLPEPTAFFKVLQVVRKDLRVARDSWWIIGSAAIALHSVEGLEISKIDILTQPGDARRVLAAKGSEPIREDDRARFRSEIYGKWMNGSYRIKVMAGFAVFTEDRWVAVQPAACVAVELPGGPVFVPSVDDLTAMCDLSRRPKDRPRKKLLEGLSSRG